MPAVEQQDGGFLITDLVPYPVVANSDAILILIALQLDAPARTGVLFQRQDSLNGPVMDIIGQAIQLLLHWLRDDNLVTQAFSRRRAMYSSMVTWSPAS